MSDPISQFSQFIKLVGKGKKAGQYLNQHQAYQAMQMMLAATPSPEQIGALLMLLRVREESHHELAGFLQASREFVVPQVQAFNVDLDLGCYAGKRRHLPWFVLAVMALAQQGYTVFLHGTQEPESQRYYLAHLWQALGWQVADSPVQAKSQLAQFGFSYMDLANVNPELDKLIQMRRLFGLRSCANTLARMLNPSNAKCSLHGVYHKHFDERHVDVAEILDEANVACFRGDGGEVEVNPERPFLLHCYQQRNQQNEKFTLAFDELLPQWQIKPSALNGQNIKPVWVGERQDKYGQAAVIGTIAVMLCLLDKLEPEQGLLKAQQVWQQRDKTWPELVC